MQEENNNTSDAQSLEMGIDKANELIEAVAAFEYRTLADVLKAQGFHFKSNKKLLQFIEFNLQKTMDPKGKWIQYDVLNPVTKETQFLFRMHKNIIINDEGGASIQLNIQTVKDEDAIN